MSERPPAVVEFDAVSKTYPGPVTAVRDVSLRGYPDDVVIDAQFFRPAAEPLFVIAASHHQ